MTPQQYLAATGQISETTRKAMNAKAEQLTSAYAARATTDAEKRLAAFLAAK